MNKTATDNSASTLVVSHDGPVTTISLNRPNSLNAITVEMLEELIAALKHADSAKALVLQGIGQAFCVGEDLKLTLAPLTSKSPELRRSFEMLQETTRLITAMPVPVVAAVHGHAVGGGAELAMAADIVVIEEGTRMRFPEVPIGHAHTGGITLRLPQIVGLMRAKELLMSGRWVHSAEAVRLGLAIESVVDARSRALEIATELAAHPARSMAAAKRGVELATFPTQDLSLRLEVEAATYCFDSAEAAETHEIFRAGNPVSGAK